MSTEPSPSGVSTVVPLRAQLQPSALWTLFTLTLRQFLRGRRVLVLGLLALLPAGLAVLVRNIDDRHSPPGSEIEFVFLFNLVPHVLLPLTALLYGSGMILDEQEEQTLTYLLIRPLPKWALYVTKLLATVCMVALLGLVFVVLTETATYLGSGRFFEVFPLKVLAVFGVMALALTAYASVFGFLSLLVQRSLIVGIVFIVVFEGILANLDFAVRKLSVMYYFRVLVLNWLEPDRRMREEWSISLGSAPEPIVCVLTLLGVAVVAAFLGARVFSAREFYVKTPESN
jgi:ABC-2 type transport system permease protein